MNPDKLEISPTELAALRAVHTAVRLIDCREEDEWQICRIEGAELMPLSKFGELSHLRITDSAEQIIIYCHHGMRSQNAAHFLRQKGFPLTWSMDGGIEQWALKIDPTTARY